jgi:hypothetical protein
VKAEYPPASGLGIGTLNAFDRAIRHGESREWLAEESIDLRFRHTLTQRGHGTQRRPLGLAMQLMRAGNQSGSSYGCHNSDDRRMARSSPSRSHRPHLRVCPTLEISCEAAIWAGLVSCISLFDGDEFMKPFSPT